MNEVPDISRWYPITFNRSDTGVVEKVSFLGAASQHIGNSAAEENA